MPSAHWTSTQQLFSLRNSWRTWTLSRIGGLAWTRYQRARARHTEQLSRLEKCSAVWWERGKNDCGVQYTAWLRKLLTIILLHPPHFLFHPFIRHAANSAMSCFFFLNVPLLTLVKTSIPTSSHLPLPPLLSHTLRIQLPLPLTNPSPLSPPEHIPSLCRRSTSSSTSEQPHLNWN